MAEGDWAASSRRFLANAETAGWSEEIVLKALPSALDDDALAAFISVPPADRSTLPQAMKQLTAVSDPPSHSRHRFADRKRGINETPLAYRSFLLALARAAYP
ncbi:unnamed protein product [Lampetra planeri]